MCHHFIEKSYYKIVTLAIDNKTYKNMSVYFESI